MMENRSFDHYFGWVADADGIQHQSYTDPAGQLGADAPLLDAREAAAWSTRAAATRTRATAGTRAAPSCSAASSRRARATTSSPSPTSTAASSASSTTRARTYTLYDRFFCSLLASTWPNRYYKWSAQSGGLKNNDPPVGTGGNQWETIFDRGLAERAERALLRLRPALLGRLGTARRTWTNPITRFYADCAAGTLPNISFVDPPFRDGGGGDGLSADEHPLGDVRLGQAFMADVVNAFVSSPNYRRGALFVLYDEWGGFFDHVTPPHVADDRASADLYEDFGQMGFRIPALAVSPARGKRQAHRLPRGPRRVRARVGPEADLVPLRARRPDAAASRQARNIGLSFDWEHPDFDAPALPDPPEVATAPCALGGGDVLDSQAAHASDLVALEELADRFGVPTYEGKLGDIFTLPTRFSVTSRRRHVPGLPRRSVAMARVAGSRR